EVDTYVITTEYQLNCVASGMLTNEDGFYTLLTNIFEYGDNLKIDQVKKDQDIANFGLYGYENIKHMSNHVYDVLNFQYLKVAFGKGLITENEFNYLEEYYAEVDPELYCNGKEETPVESKSILLKAPLKAPLLTSSVSAPTSGFYVGGSIKIINNGLSNFYFAGGKAITIGTGTVGEGNGVVAPTEDMKIGVTLADGKGKFTTNGTANYSANFFSDNANYGVYFDNAGTEGTTDDFLALGYAIKNNASQTEDDIDGYITLSKTVANSEETITFNVTVGIGYKLKADSVKATYNDGEKDVELELIGENNAYTFTMPAYAVTVTATFVEKQTISISDETYHCTYNGEARSFQIISGEGPVLTGFKFEYYVDDDWTESAPTNAGSYNVKITRPEDDTYKAYEKVITNGLVINKVKVAVPTENTGLVYNKTEQTGVNLPDDALYTLSNNTATGAGNYTAIATLSDKDNYEWDLETPTSENQSIDWSIAKQEVSAPTIGSKVYTGSTLTADVEDSDLYEVTENIGVTNAGKYDVKLTLTDSVNYKWATLENDEINLTFTISPKTITLEVVDVATGTYTYDGQAKITTATYTGLIGDDELSYTLSYSDNINAGTCTVSIESASITEGTASNYNLIIIDTGSIVIDKKDITGATVVYDESKAYNGQTQTFAVTSVTVDDLTATYNVTNNSAKDYNENGYTLTITANGNFTGTIEKAFAITKLAVSEPTISGEYKYNGEAQTVALNGVESYMTTTDSLTQTNAGVYTITYVLDNNHMWAEGVDGVITWEIKATSLTPVVENPDPEKKQDVIVEIDEGVTNDITVTVEITVEVEVESKELTVDYYKLDEEKVKLEKNEKVGVVFDVKLIQMVNGEPRVIQPSDIKDGTTIRVKMLIPDTVDIGKVTRILHVHSADDIEVIEFDASKVANGYYEIEVDRLSEFAFIYEKDVCFIHWILIALLVVGAVLFVLFY
ncbi:MAG: hypothetical protein KBS91_04870, partial [Firmicutes bacterium]|nr:hypothetical protein [Candidatus Caballimonas caccae]